MLKNFNLHDAVLCEDVRQEITGKFLIIGAYSGNIMVSSFPANIAVNFYLPFEPLVSGEVLFSIRYSIENGATAILEGGVEVNAVGETSALFGPRVELPVGQEGALTIDFSEDGGKTWVAVVKKSIMLGVTASPFGTLFA
ncbi:hypothetical protein [Novosphingobium barchaimii]|uniref:hypothetical protein n=1 Tax=Novosphingobium barchaimii TaxID=1420591 RepID=UPI0011E00CBE|nr:hypothetical protein [Novosphingobium barchaimii]